MTDTTVRTGIADYEFVRSLGDSAHGRYYLALCPARLPVDEEFVTVKLLIGQTSDEAFTLATGELRAFAAVDSPFLVRLFDAGQDGDTFFYAMEYHPLGSLASPARPLDRSEVLRAVAHAARAAHALHQAGIADCDIKPANILLHAEGGHLADLGLAQVLTPGQAISGMAAVASVEFVDPAVMLGGQVGRASDIWSLGSTLHRVLSGSGIYGEIQDRDPLLALRTALSTTPDVSDALAPAEAELIRATLDADPTRRPETALVVAEWIERWLPA